jgi:hypothetical protein
MNPQVEDITDNIAEPSLETTTAVQQNAEIIDVNPNAGDFSNLNETCKRIIEHHKKDFKQLMFTVPSQIVDGCGVEFTDVETKTIVATGRLRFRNRMVVDKGTGNMQITVQISDISYSSSSITLNLEPSIVDAAPVAAPIIN